MKVNDSIRRISSKEYAQVPPSDTSKDFGSKKLSTFESMQRKSRKDRKQQDDSSGKKKVLRNLPGVELLNLPYLSGHYSTPQNILAEETKKFEKLESQIEMSLNRKKRQER